MFPRRGCFQSSVLSAFKQDFSYQHIDTHALINGLVPGAAISEMGAFEGVTLSFTVKSNDRACAC